MIIDLSHTINSNTPVYPGDPKVVVKEAGSLLKDGFHDNVVTIGTHVGTHIDAPAHMLEGGAALSEQDINLFVGDGVLIEVDGEYDLDSIKAADIKPGDIVLFRTGMSALYDQPQKYFSSFPRMPEEVHSRQGLAG